MSPPSFSYRQVRQRIAVVLCMVVLLSGFLIPPPVHAGFSFIRHVLIRITLPTVVMVWVRAHQSDLHEVITQADIDSQVDIPGSDYTVKGIVIANHYASQVQCTVDTLALNLVNGSDSITVNLDGTIGGTNISTAPFVPTFTNKIASINISGDIDESTVNPTDAPGTYSGTFTITATII